MAHHTTTEVTNGLSVCGDCALMIANGDGTPEHVERMVAVWGEGVNGVLGLTLAGTDDEHFSWSRCDGCGDTLGGDRFDAAHIAQIVVR